MNERSFVIEVTMSSYDNNIFKRKKPLIDPMHRFKIHYFRSKKYLKRAKV